jgi:hypothetical protein
MRSGLHFLAILISILLAACSGTVDIESTIAAGIAQTQQVSELQTAAAGGTTYESTAAPESNSATLTPTLGVPLVTVSQDTNCRAGPAIYYAHVTTVSAGVPAEVVALHAQGDEYVIIANPNGSGRCWLWLQYADIKDFSAYNLPTINTPPTPTPSFNWNGTWTIWFGSPPSSHSTIVLTQAGNSVSGSFDFLGPSTVTHSGTLSANFQILSGTWSSTNGSSGGFQWQIKEGNSNQFVGSVWTDGSEPVDFCGARLGASQPSPCFWP